MPHMLVRAVGGTALTPPSNEGAREPFSLFVLNSEEAGSYGHADGTGGEYRCPDRPVGQGRRDGEPRGSRGHRRVGLFLRPRRQDARTPEDNSVHLVWRRM